MRHDNKPEGGLVRLVSGCAQRYGGRRLVRDEEFMARPEDVDGMLQLGMASRPAGTYQTRDMVTAPRKRGRPRKTR